MKEEVHENYPLQGKNRVRDESMFCLAIRCYSTLPFVLGGLGDPQHGGYDGQIEAQNVWTANAVVLGAKIERAKIEEQGTIARLKEGGWPGGVNRTLTVPCVCVEGWQGGG